MYIYWNFIEFIHQQCNNITSYAYVLLTISARQCCNSIWFGYDAHDIVMAQSYSCIHEGVYYHVDNLAYKNMKTWIHEYKREWPPKHMDKYMMTWCILIDYDMCLLEWSWCKVLSLFINSEGFLYGMKICSQ